MFQPRTFFSVLCLNWAVLKAALVELVKTCSLSNLVALSKRDRTGFIIDPQDQYLIFWDPNSHELPLILHFKGCSIRNIYIWRDREKEGGGSERIYPLAYIWFLCLLSSDFQFECEMENGPWTALRQTEVRLWVIALQKDEESEPKHSRIKQKSGLRFYSCVCIWMCVCLSNQWLSCFLCMHECYHCTASSVAERCVKDAL